MFSIVLWLKVVITIVFSIVLLFVNNYYLFWLFAFYLLLLTIVDKNLKSLLGVFAIVLVLLFCYYSKNIKILLRILSIVTLIIIFVCSLTKKDKLRYYYQDKKARKKIFKDYAYPLIKDKNEKQSLLTYNKDVDNKRVNDKDFDDLYLCARMRFYGYNNTYTNMKNGLLSKYDLLFMVVAIIVLILFCIFW